jgi:hypothetical protein
MDKTIARILLKSLIQRVVREPGTGVYKLDGALSEDEYAALIAAFETLGEPRGHVAGLSDVKPGPVPAPTVEAPPVSLVVVSSGTHTTKVAVEEEVARPHASPNAPATLSLAATVKKIADARRNAAPLSDVTLCLDFGTARSKAFAVGRGKDGEDQYLELGLGKRADEIDSIYAVSSSVWVDENGRVYVGRPAVNRSLQHDGPEHRRLDSLKQELSQGVMESLDDIKAPKDINPTNVPLTYGHLITLYLAFLTDLAESELVERYGLSHSVARRFALPSWDAERLAWGEGMLRRYLARAQIVGEHFRGAWRDGIPAHDVRSVIEAVRALDDSAIPYNLILDGVQEPVAAGASRLRAEGTKGLVMVIDVGAGTTDFALFLTQEEDAHERVRAWQIGGSVRTMKLAGDSLDAALRNLMLEKLGVRNGDPEFRRVNAELQRRIRSNKETLFKKGTVAFYEGLHTISMDEFLLTDGVKTYTQGLQETFAQVLTGIHPSFLEALSEGGLRVVLTGGGATLPMVKNLATGSTLAQGRTLIRSGAPLTPEKFKQHPLKDEYPQLAVAVGGASSDLPELKKPLQEYPGRRKSRVEPVKIYR